MRSETAKHRNQVDKFCRGNGVDLGSAGDPVVPTAVQVDLPEGYCPALDGRYPVQLRGDATDLFWFRDGVLDYVYSSHLLEDFEDWDAVLREWDRVLRPGGFLVVLLPDRVRWARAVAAGQPPNHAHKHEGRPGELTAAVARVGRYEVVRDGFADDVDYTLIFVGRKLP